MSEIRIVADDPSLVVAVKPGGMLSVPGRGPEKEDCLVARIRALFPQMIVQPAVHRLDMATSGLMVLAKTDAAHRHLSIQFAKRQVEKTYIALLEGTLDEEEGRISLPFRLDPDNRPHQVYDPERGKMGITLWHNMGCQNGRTRIAFFPMTGRTHQLRLHAAHPLGLGIPIVGDNLYGHGHEGDKLFLHASRLAFSHPLSGEWCVLTDAPDF